MRSGKARHPFVARPPTRWRRERHLLISSKPPAESRHSRRLQKNGKRRGACSRRSRPASSQGILTRRTREWHACPCEAPPRVYHKNVAAETSKWLQEMRSMWKLDHIPTELQYRLSIQFFFFFLRSLHSSTQTAGRPKRSAVSVRWKRQSGNHKTRGQPKQSRAPCSQIHEIVIIVNTAVLITIKVCFLLNRCNPNHIPAESFFLEISKPVPKFTLQSRGPRMAETFLCEKERS